MTHHGEHHGHHQHEHHGHGTHPGHEHEHGPDCGHTAIRHAGHVDYVHDGHLHHPEGGEVVEHRLEVSDANPSGCTGGAEAGHDAEHHHGPGCGHEAVPHGDHVDYIVEGRLHHPHGDHCDDHGSVEMA